jgi:hypothetical protein
MVMKKANGVNICNTQGLDMDILDCIEKDISTYKMSGNILLCGGFNVRTASQPDFIVNDDNSYTKHIYKSYEKQK